MVINTYTRGKFGIIKVLEDLTIHTDPGPIKRLIEDFLRNGTKNIAISFTAKTFPSSRLMAVLVTSREMLRRDGGTMAIIGASDKMIDTFNILNLAHGDYFLLVNSEEELPGNTNTN